MAGVTPESAKNKRAILLFNANGYSNVCGNSTTCDIFSTNDNTINSAAISQIWWGVGGNTAAALPWITIGRGANTYLSLTGTGHMQFSERGSSFVKDAAAANVIVTFNGTTTGFLRIEMTKQNTANLQNTA